MNAKKIVSMALAMTSASAVLVSAVASEYRTGVIFDAAVENAIAGINADDEGVEESYYLSVPVTMKPGETAEVTLTGTWSSERKVTVTADASVTLTSDEGDTRTLTVSFDGLEVTGQGNTSIQETAYVEVESMTALSGYYEGGFQYQIDISDLVDSVSEAPDADEESQGEADVLLGTMGEAVPTEDEDVTINENAEDSQAENQEEEPALTDESQSGNMETVTTEDGSQPEANVQDEDPEYAMLPPEASGCENAEEAMFPPDAEQRTVDAPVESLGDIGRVEG